MDNFQTLLRAVDTTADRIHRVSQAALSLPGLEREIANAWLRIVKQTKEEGDPLLPYLFAANDVLQESKRIGSPSTEKLVAEFEKVLVEGISVLTEDYSLQEQVSNVVLIWNKRSVLSKPCLKKLMVEIGEQQAEDEHAAPPSTSANAAPNKPSLEGMPIPVLLSLQASLASTLSSVTTDSEVSNALSASSQGNLGKLEKVEELDELLKTLEIVTTKLESRKENCQQLPEIQSAIINALEEQLGKQGELGAKAANNREECDALAKKLDEFELKYQNNPTYYSDGVLQASYVKREYVLQKKAPEKPSDTDKQNTSEEKNDGAVSTRPMFYNKQLKKYVPLPSLNDEDSWRDR